MQTNSFKSIPNKNSFVRLVCQSTFAAGGWVSFGLEGVDGGMSLIPASWTNDDTVLACLLFDFILA